MIINTLRLLLTLVTTQRASSRHWSKRAALKRTTFYLLLNDDATRASIMETYHALAKRAKPNDRVVFFFAGHGHTEQSRRGGDRPSCFPPMEPLTIYRPLSGGTN